MTEINTALELDAWREKILSDRDASKPRIMVCGGTGCLALESDKVAEALQKVIQEQGVEAKVELITTGCPGFCEQGPLVVVHPEKIFYIHVKPKDAKDIISETIGNGKVVERLLYTDPLTGKKVVHEDEVPFYKEQTRVILKNSGIIDPEKIEDYIAADGYKAVSKALFEMTPESVLEEVKKANLRGRGGAGFPAAIKWELCRREQADQRYIICNADEGDPGAFQDRGIIEGNPHSILEGMILGAYAIGASKGYIYIRHEYPLAVKMIKKAIVQAREQGFLGENILGSNFSFDLEVQLGAGAFVCGS